MINRIILQVGQDGGVDPLLNKKKGAPLDEFPIELDFI